MLHILEADSGVGKDGPGWACGIGQKADLYTLIEQSNIGVCPANGTSLATSLETDILKAEDTDTLLTRISIDASEPAMCSYQLLTSKSGIIMLSSSLDSHHHHKNQKNW